MRVVVLPPIPRRTALIVMRRGVGAQCESCITIRTIRPAVLNAKRETPGCVQSGQG